MVSRWVMAFDPFTAPLVPLPSHPDGLAWPTNEWPVGEVPDGVDLDSLIDELFNDSGPLARTFASVVIHKGKLIQQRYAHELEHFDREPTPIDQDTPLLSWSMAKSMTHALVGMLVAEGKLDVNAPPGEPQWAEPGDPRGQITLDQLLEMRDGLDFLEDYVDGERSDVINMLFGEGAADVAAFAANRGLIAEPGTRFNYSSGTTNIISATVARAVGPGEPYRQFLHRRLFDPIGMSTATAKFDDAGTFIGSSYVYATARDFAKFGYLYLRDGVWDGTRLLPDGWVDHARAVRSKDDDGLDYYGAQWWLHGDEYGTFRCSGYEGQRIVVCPALDLVIVRIGKMPSTQYPALRKWVDKVVAAFAAL